jgi:hypothetical protein
MKIGASYLGKIGLRVVNSRVLMITTGTEDGGK